MSRIAMIMTMLLAGVAATDPAEAIDRPCGASAPCKTTSGTYHLAFPADWDGKSTLPAVVFFHGHNSSGRNAIRNKSLARKFTKRGYLMIAPNGTAGNGRTALGWPANRAAKGRRDDIAFVSEVMASVRQRLPLDKGKLLVTGFSSGGSMAWHLACYTFDKFTAFAPVAGGLRRPAPEGKCPAGPVRLLHIHGFSDAQVPLEGRAIRDWHQGDVFEGLSKLRQTNGCRSNPTAFTTRGRYQCRQWTGCKSRKDIEFCLHPRGHELPRGWDNRVFQWFEVE